MENNIPDLPTLSDGSRIQFEKKTTLVITCPNPNCNNQLDITNLSFGTVIECPNCNNITWVPEQKPKWWFKLKNFILTIIISFIIGLVSSYIASYAYNYVQKLNDNQTKEMTEE